MRITISGGNLYYFVSGDLVGSGSFTKPTADKFYIKSSGIVYLDELRVTTGSLFSTGSYNPSNSPYDTNKVLALPDNLTANTIYVQHSTSITNSRIGGVRPSNPSYGFFYIPLHSDYTGGQPQLYTDGNWVNVTAMVYNGSTTVNALGYQFSPIGANSDVINPDNCSHNWVERNRIDATCTASGSVKYGCSKCSKTKEETLPIVPDAHDWQETNRVDAECLKAGSVEWTCSRCNRTKRETLPALGHDWLEPIVNPATCLQDGLKTTPCSRCDETIVQALPATDHFWVVVRTVTTQYDDDGNKIQAGYVLYECEYCKEQYRTTDATQRPPALGGDVGACAHDWVENIADSVEPTCTLAGVKSYICSKCGKAKLESVPLLDHDWKVKATIPNQYDNEGNQISVGFTIFECLRCQEQYKSIDGTAPPSLNPSGGSSGSDGEEKEGLLGWLMSLFFSFGLHGFSLPLFSLLAHLFCRLT